MEKPGVQNKGKKTTPARTAKTHGGAMKHQSHDERITRIAEELGVPVETVKKAYLDTLRDLTADARVHDYLHLFVVKRLVAMFRKRDHK
ncbi:MAG: DUF3562 domain-containing protein [Pyrinomonadaceae bacterium]